MGVAQVVPESLKGESVGECERACAPACMPCSLLSSSFLPSSAICVPRFFRLRSSRRSRYCSSAAMMSCLKREFRSAARSSRSTGQRMYRAALARDQPAVSSATTTSRLVRSSKCDTRFDARFFGVAVAIMGFLRVRGSGKLVGCVLARTSSSHCSTRGLLSRRQPFAL